MDDILNGIIDDVMEMCLKQRIGKGQEVQSDSYTSEMAPSHSLLSSLSNLPATQEIRSESEARLSDESIEEDEVIGCVANDHSDSVEDGYSSAVSCTSTLELNPREEDDTVPETPPPSDGNAPVREYKDKPWMWNFREADRGWVVVRNHEETRDCFGLYMVEASYSISDAPIDIIEDFHRWRWFKTKTGKRKQIVSRVELLEQWKYWIKEVYIEEISDDSGIEFPVAQPVPYAVAVVANNTAAYTALDLIEGRPYRCAAADPLVEQIIKYEMDYTTYQLSMGDRINLSEYERLREHMHRQDEHMRRQDMEIQQLKDRVRSLEYNEF